VRHVRMLGLCLVAALALGAYAVSSASALEWGKCELAGPGHNYTGPNCTKSEKAKPKGTGEYEWRKASEVAAKRVAEGKSANVPFEGESVGSGGVLYAEWAVCRSKVGEEYPGQMTRQACEAINPPESHRVHEGYPFVECVGENNSGETEGKNKVANIHVTFTGCKAIGVVPCGNVGPEEVATETLKGKLGWINKASKEVGVLLEPAAHHGSFAAFDCPGIGVSEAVGVGSKKAGAAHTSSGCTQTCEGATPEEEKHGGYDGIISPITPVNVMTSEFTQEYKAVNTESNELCPENVPSSFEGKHIDLLENFPTSDESGFAEMWGCAAEEITNVNTSEEEGEIKA
jgi:hypothetical protein